jgi:DNA helicase MCM8
MMAAEGCKSRTFEPCRSDAKSVDWQKLRVQEIMGTDKQQEGQVCTAHPKLGMMCDPAA